MLFVPVKCNLSAGISGLAYRIVPSPHDPAVPIVAWEPGAVALTADEAMEPLPKATLREAAAEWLEGVLAAGPVLTQEVERRGRQAGYSARTLVRAKESLGIVAFREGYQGPYLWRLPGASGLTRVGTGADDAQSAP